MIPVALSIAGSDPIGGAGIQADLKTFHQFGVYGEAVITLLTVQNTVRVSRVDCIPAELVMAQLNAILEDIPPHAAKTGALGNREIVEAIAAAAAEFRFPLVVDPVMISKHGQPLISPDAVAAVRDAIKAEIHAVTGLDPMLGNDVSLSLFPSGTVRFHNVLLGNDHSSEPAVTADELTARLRYFPLLAGRIEISDVTLVHPTINVAFSADGRSNWSGLISSLAHALQPAPERMASFSEIGI